MHRPAPCRASGLLQGLLLRATTWRGPESCGSERAAWGTPRCVTSDANGRDRDGNSSEIHRLLLGLGGACELSVLRPRNPAAVTSSRKLPREVQVSGGNVSLPESTESKAQRYRRAAPCPGHPKVGSPAPGSPGQHQPWGDPERLGEVSPKARANEAPRRAPRRDPRGLSPPLTSGNKARKAGLGFLPALSLPAG